MPPLAEDDEAVSDRAWIPLLPPVESDEEDELPDADFMPEVATPREDGADSEPALGIPESDLVLPPADDVDDADDLLFHEPDRIVVEPLVEEDESDEGGFEPFLGVPAEPRLATLSRFAVEWQEAETARQLLPVGRGFVAMGRECRHHTVEGDLLARGPLPPGFVRAAVMRRTTWMRTASKVSPVDTGFEMLCIARGRLLLRSGDQWLELLDEDQRSEFEASDIVQRGDDVLVSSRDGRWFSLEDGTLRPAFAGRKLRALGACSPWVGLGDELGRPLLMALEGESVRPLFVSPVAAPRLHGLERTLALDAGADGLYWCQLPEVRRELIIGSSAFRGVCLGDVAGSRKLWTTLEHGEHLAIVELDLSSGQRCIACSLPWAVGDDDLPTVYDMVWLPEARRLLIASDQGVVSLLRHDGENSASS